MLKKRVITASVLLPVVLLTILYGSTTLVNIISAIILCAAAFEWNKLIGIQQLWLNWIFILLMVSFGLLCKVMNVAVFDCCLIASVWWLLSFFAVAMYPKGQTLWSNKIVGFILGVVLFIPTWLALGWLHETSNFGPKWVAFLCFLIWGADVGAYITGKLWGKKKLIEQVSAGKTWVGVLGAFFFAFLIVFIFATFWLQEQKHTALISLSVIVVIFSILGDLTESIFKRVRGVKDSGALLPGHGGVLDRIDGLLAAVPTFIVGVYFFYY